MPAKSRQSRRFPAGCALKGLANFFVSGSVSSLTVLLIRLKSATRRFLELGTNAKALNRLHTHVLFMYFMSPGRNGSYQQKVLLSVPTLRIVMRGLRIHLFIFKIVKNIPMAAQVKGKYVDGFVLVVPKENVAEYRKIARKAGKVWKKYGALDYKECMLDDPTPEGVKLPFPKLTKMKPDETVWFSYIVYKNKKHRDQVNAKVMADPSMNPDDMEKMPFDMKRMAYAGFKVEVDA